VRVALNSKRSESLRLLKISEREAEATDCTDETDKKKDKARIAIASNVHHSLRMKPLFGFLSVKIRVIRGSLLGAPAVLSRRR
jgi:hypothetical protein